MNSRGNPDLTISNATKAGHILAVGLGRGNRRPRSSHHAVTRGQRQLRQYPIPKPFPLPVIDQTLAMAFLFACKMI